MEPPEPDWPATRWSLTAPEAYVLDSVGDGSGVTAFKLAVKELVARRALRLETLETRGRLGRRRQRSALIEGPQMGVVSEQPLIAVLALFADVDKRTLQTTEASGGGTRPIDGVLVEAFARAARKRFRGFHGYRDRHVVAALVARGLMTVQSGGFWSSGRKGWTDEGREADDELEWWLEVARERFAGWMSDDPAKALAYTAGAGAAILLMDDLYPEFALLGRHLAERPAGGGGGDGAVAGAADDEERAGAGPDPSDPGPDGIDLGALGTDFGGLDGLDAAFNAVDVGIDAGAGGGGGGDGGGDGGGGGW